MDWPRIASLFEWDGGLRDIYVLETSANDWSRVLEAIRDAHPSAVIREAAHESPIPRPAPDIRQLIGSGLMLAVDLDGIRVHSFFFDDAEIEFDIDPRDISGPEQLERLLAFMRLLGEATEKPVLLTEENGRDAALCRWDRGAVFWPPLATSDA